MKNKMVSIAELADVNPKTSLQGLATDTLVSFIPMADVTEAGQWIGRQERQLKEVRVGYTPFTEEDVLFAKITPCMENGKGAHVKGLKNGIGFGSTEFHVLRARNGNDPRYLFHWLQAKPTRSRAIAFMGGSAGQQRVRYDFFINYKVPAIEPTEQSRIVYILDTIDEAIVKAEAVIAKFKHVRAGMLHDLLSYGLDENGQLRDPIAHPEQFKDTPLGRIPRMWEEDHLLNRITLPEGQVDPRISPYSEWLLIAPDHIESATGRLIERKTAKELGVISGKYVFRPGDVVYSKIRPYLRKAVLATERGLCSADMYPLRPNDNVDSTFLLASILSEPFSRFASAVSMRSGFPKINRKEIAEFIMPWPSINEQRLISERLNTISTQQRAEDLELLKLKKLKTGLQDDLLTGRVRVPETMMEGAIMA